MKPIKNRTPFIYVEKCSLNQKESCLAITQKGETKTIPAEDFAVVMVGPGATITSSAVKLLTQHGVMIQFVGEEGVALYSISDPYLADGKRISAQIEAASNLKKKRRVAAHLYRQRFGEIVAPEVDIASMRGLEGSKSRVLYKKFADEIGVPWVKRDSDSRDIANMSINISAGIMYSVATSAIFCAGFTPSVGFFHDGGDRPFSCDIADRYRFDITIPVAMKVARNNPPDVWREVRRAMRDEIARTGLMDNLIRDAIAAVEAA